MSTTTLDTPRLPAQRVATVNWSACALGLVALLAAPLVLGDYYLHAMVLAMIFLLPALGLNLTSATPACCRWPRASFSVSVRMPRR